MTDHAGRTMRYEYDGAGNLIKVSSTQNSTPITQHLYSYNSNHGITSKANALGETVTITYKYPDKGIVEKIYNPVGTRMIQQGKQPTGHVMTYAYDFKNGTFYVTDFNGVKKKKVTNDKGRLLLEEEVQAGAEPRLIRKIEYLPNRTEKHTDSAGNITTIQRDEWRNIVKVTDGEGNVTSLSYNTRKQPQSVTDALGNVTRMEYDTAGNLTRLTQAQGKAEQMVTTYGYNGYGEVTSATANGLTTTYTYTSSGKVASITDPRNNASTIEYDLMGNPTKITDPMGNIVTATYDLMGKPLTITDPKGKVTTNTYNAKGNLITTTDPLGNLTTFAYTYANNISSVTDAEGKTTAYEYDGMKRLTKITDAAGGITSFAYDSGCASCGSGGDVSSLTDPKNQTTAYSFDKGLMVKETNPLGKYRTFVYNRNKQVTGIVDSMGRMTVYGYDAIGRLTSKMTPDDTTTYSYDAIGRLKTAKNSASDLAFTYDAKGNLTSERDNLRNTQVTYAYDQYGNRSIVTGPAGMATYNYDTHNRLTSITDWNGKTVSYTLDTLSRRTKETIPNGLATTYGYDDISRLNSLLTKNSLQQTIDSYAYTYDKVGNRKTMTTPAGEHAYGYDDLYQLISASHPDQQAEGYAYDPVGNRHPLSYQHSAWNQIIEDDSFTYTYDDNGNRTSRTAKDGMLKDVYTWNAENKLIKFERFDGPSATAPVTTATYTYDALGRRIGKVVNGATTGYVDDGMHIIAETGGGGAVTTAYVHGGGIDEPVSMTRGGATYYYHRDALGSITELTDSAGAVVQQYRYDSFGNIVYTGNSAFVQPFTFTAREYDPESGLYHYRARQYDPKTGTFISADPIGFEGGDVNLFRYVNNSPQMLRDPLGLWTGIDDAVFAGGGAVIGMLGRGVGDLITWNLSSWEDYVGAAVGGAAAGEVLLYTANPFLAGATGGLAGNLTTQGLKNLSGKHCGMDLESVGFDTAFGALTGFIPGRPRIAGINAGRGSDLQVFRQMIKKAANGTISNVTPATALKMGRGAFYQYAVGQGAAAGALGSTIFGNMYP